MDIIKKNEIELEIERHVLGQTKKLSDGSYEKIFSRNLRNNFGIFTYNCHLCSVANLLGEIALRTHINGMKHQSKIHYDYIPDAKQFRAPLALGKDTQYFKNEQEHDAQKLKAKQPASSSKPSSSSSAPPPDSVELAKLEIAKVLAQTLIDQGRTDVSPEELSEIVDEFMKQQNNKTDGKRVKMLSKSVDAGDDEVAAELFTSLVQSQQPKSMSFLEPLKLDPMAAIFQIFMLIKRNALFLLSLSLDWTSIEKWIENVITSAPLNFRTLVLLFSITLCEIEPHDSMAAYLKEGLNLIMDFDALVLFIKENLIELNLMYEFIDEIDIKLKLLMIMSHYKKNNDSSIYYGQCSITSDGDFNPCRVMKAKPIIGNASKMKEIARIVSSIDMTYSRDVRNFLWLELLQIAEKKGKNVFKCPLIVDSQRSNVETQLMIELEKPPSLINSAKINALENILQSYSSD